MIKTYDIQELRSFALEILTKTYMELNQNPTEDTIVGMSLSLAEDLQQDFPKLEIEDIRQAFRNGVRRTDNFNIGPKTWYKWIRTHRDLIWQNDGKDERQKDKRLHYRSRKGTGMIELKKSKLLK